MCVSFMKLELRVTYCIKYKTRVLVTVIKYEEDTQRGGTDNEDFQLATTFIDPKFAYIGEGGEGERRYTGKWESDGRECRAREMRDDPVG